MKTVAVVWGAGGIGTALANQIKTNGQHDIVVLVSRRALDLAAPDIEMIQADMLDEASLEAAVEAIAAMGTIDLVIVATGLLHDDKTQPEKTIRQASAQSFQEVLTVNTIGPALIAKHFYSKMPMKGRTVFAAVSARVGSISGNRLGGWYAYRASKAALNMVLKTLSIEWGRRNPQAICIGLHPGTVDTDLSAPFQTNVARGRLFTALHAAEKLTHVVENVTAQDSGNLFAFDGTRVPE